MRYGESFAFALQLGLQSAKQSEFPSENLLKMDMVDVFPIFPQQDADVVFASGNFHADLEEDREDRQ